MSQRAVELLIGRVMTDEELRTRFLTTRLETLAELRAQGYELTDGEIQALLETSADVWAAAEKVSPRLRRCSL